MIVPLSMVGDGSVLEFNSTENGFIGACIVKSVLLVDAVHPDLLLSS